MDQDEIREHVAALPDVWVQVASADNGAPEVAWGDTFFFHDPAGEGEAGDPSRRPFATIVTGDYPGFDERSHLDREGVFRLNVCVGRDTVRAVAGEPPADGDDDVDYAVLDRVIPHPVYARQGWLSVLNPDATADQARSLLTRAHARAVAHHRRA
jgi:hypothetical protein